MTDEERRAINEAAYPRLKPLIDANYPRGQFVAIDGGQIVADDTDFGALQKKLDAMGIGRIVALIERAGDPIPGRAGFPGMLTMNALGRVLWSFDSRTGA